MSHTPGPWGYQRIDSGEFLITDPRPPKPPFEFSTVGKMGLEEDDAKLVAAAPDLLAACQSFAKALEQDTESDEGMAIWRAVWLRVESAIAKAEGSSS